jgi:uncharacterized membrane protein YagU involved in acid resistance
MCAAAAASLFEGSNCKWENYIYHWLFLFVFSILVKAFLAKAKDEFQVKYDKPTQVS